MNSNGPMAELIGSGVPTREMYYIEIGSCSDDRKTLYRGITCPMVFEDIIEGNAELSDAEIEDILWANGHIRLYVETTNLDGKIISNKMVKKINLFDLKWAKPHVKKFNEGPL